MTSVGARSTGKALGLLAVLIGFTGCLQPAYQETFKPDPRACTNCAHSRLGNTATEPSTIQRVAFQDPAATDADPLKPALEPHGHGELALGHPAPGPVPREKIMSSHPPYRVAPPDILFLEALRIVPRGPYRLEPLEVLQIAVADTLPNQPINGTFMISPEGTINLGFGYGSVRIGGLTLEDAQLAIRRQLSNILKSPTVNLALTQYRGLQAVRGEHLVRPDGTISLGLYGSVYVAGLTLGQVKCVVEKHLSEYLVNPQVSVDVYAYNSQKYYIVLDGAGFGGAVYPMPITGNETVLDAISAIQGVATVSSRNRMWVARPSPVHLGCNIIMPVDWQAVLQGASTATNYQLFPGDRVYVGPDPLIKMDNYLAKAIAPIERLLGLTLLGAGTYNSIANSGNNNGALIVGR